MSGGKGGGQSSQVQIPQYMEDALQQQIARAQAAQNMPYAPIMGPTMAGFTGGQRAGMESQAALAQRMGIIPQSYDPSSGYMPDAIDVGNGLTAYASYPGAKERVLAAFAENPELQRQYEAMYAPAPTYQDMMASIAADRAAANAPRGTLDVIAGGNGPEGEGRVANQTGQISGFERAMLDTMRDMGGMSGIAAKGMTSRNDFQTEGGYNTDFGYDVPDDSSWSGK